MADDVPETESDAFDWIDLSKMILYVPKNSMEAYKAEYPWNGFGTILPIDTHTDVTLPIGDFVSIEIKNGIVYLSNLPLNSAVNVYTEGGELWESRCVTETTVSLQLPRQTVYVIKASGRSFKVKL